MKSAPSVGVDSGSPIPTTALGSATAAGTTGATEGVVAGATVGDIGGGAEADDGPHGEVPRLDTTSRLVRSLVVRA
jgi:hypothetical protein